MLETRIAGSFVWPDCQIIGEKALSDPALPGCDFPSNRSYDRVETLMHARGVLAPSIGKRKTLECLTPTLRADFAKSKTCRAALEPGLGRCWHLPSPRADPSSVTRPIAQFLWISMELAARQGQEVLRVSLGWNRATVLSRFSRRTLR